MIKSNQLTPSDILVFLFYFHGLQVEKPKPYFMTEHILKYFREGELIASFENLLAHGLFEKIEIQFIDILCAPFRVLEQQEWTLEKKETNKKLANFLKTRLQNTRGATQTLAFLPKLSYRAKENLFKFVLSGFSSSPGIQVPKISKSVIKIEEELRFQIKTYNGPFYQIDLDERLTIIPFIHLYALGHIVLLAFSIPVNEEKPTLQFVPQENMKKYLTNPSSLNLYDWLQLQVESPSHIVYIPKLQELQWSGKTHKLRKGTPKTILEHLLTTKSSAIDTSKALTLSEARNYTNLVKSIINFNSNFSQATQYPTSLFSVSPQSIRLLATVLISEESKSA